MTDETVVEADGVRVTKSFDADGFPVPAVRFDVTSSRSEDTTLTITDEIPDEFDIDQIGFHPEYGSEHWTATGDGVVRFERSIDANEEFTTVYGVRMGEDQEPTAFLDTPTVTVGDETPATGIEDIVPPESSDVVRELAGGKRDTIPGLESEPETAVAAEEALEETTATVTESSQEPAANEPLLDALHEDEGEIVDAEAVEPGVTANGDTESDTETTESPEESTETEPSVAEVASGDTTEESSTDTTDESTVDSTPEVPPDDEESEVTKPPSTDTKPSKPVNSADVAAELAAQIRNDDIDDEDIDLLRKELAPKRSEVQLEHLQSRVSEMEAYADALGAFIDENGDAKGLLNDLQSDVQSMHSDIASVKKDVSDAETSRAEIRGTLASVEEKVSKLDDVDDRLDRVAGDVDALDDRVGGVEETASAVEDIQDDIESLRADLSEVKEWRDQLSDVFGG